MRKIESIKDTSQLPSRHNWLDIGVNIYLTLCVLLLLSSLIPFSPVFQYQPLNEATPFIVMLPLIGVICMIISLRERKLSTVIKAFIASIIAAYIFYISMWYLTH